jgi:hypothetical protein
MVGSQLHIAPIVWALDISSDICIVYIVPIKSYIVHIIRLIAILYFGTTLDFYHCLYFVFFSRSLLPIVSLVFWDSYISHTLCTIRTTTPSREAEIQF